MSRKRRRERFHRRTAPGASPGTLVADPQAPRPRLRVIAYAPEEIVERELADVRAVRELYPRFAVTWLDVQGLGDAATIEQVGEVFGLHRLWLEDVLNVHQRPKVEQHGAVRFLVVRAVEGDGVADTDQISICLGPRFVVTFQEKYGDGFELVRQRLRKGQGRVRGAGADYLAYRLLDATVDLYFPLLEKLGERLEALEDDLIERPGTWCLGEIHAIRRELIGLRRAVWPLRESIHHLVRERDAAFAEETRLYLNDCYDHTVQIMDLVESYREVASGLLEIYLTSMSHRMNEVMKVLTVISTIFIPLTFLAGVYGMNFDPDAGPLSMPELRWPLGYVACLAVMAVTAIGLVLWFRHRGWIFAGRTDRPPERRERA